MAGANKQWIVTPAEKSKFDAMFAQADKNTDGLVSGNFIILAIVLIEPEFANMRKVKLVYARLSVQRYS